MSSTLASSSMLHMSRASLKMDMAWSRSWAAAAFMALHIVDYKFCMPQRSLWVADLDRSMEYTCITRGVDLPFS